MQLSEPREIKLFTSIGDVQVVEESLDLIKVISGLFECIIALFTCNFPENWGDFFTKKHFVYNQTEFYFSTEVDKVSEFTESCKQGVPGFERLHQVPLIYPDFNKTSRISFRVLDGLLQKRLSSPNIAPDWNKFKEAHFKDMDGNRDVLFYEKTRAFTSPKHPKQN